MPFTACRQFERVTAVRMQVMKIKKLQRNGRAKNVESRKESIAHNNFVKGPIIQFLDHGPSATQHDFS